MLIIVILITVYILSCFVHWDNVRRDYSKGGRYRNIHPDTMDFIMIFIPIYNTGFAFLGLLSRLGNKEDEIKKSFFDKFFRVKK